MSIDSAMLYDGSYKQSENKSSLKGADRKRSPFITSFSEIIDSSVQQEYHAMI